jgi:large subunit ribosomal protein L25
MDVTLTAETGRPTGSRNANRLRADGMIPAVVYGLGQEPKAVTVAWAELRRALTTDAGVNALIDLAVDGETHLSMVKDLQRHPVRREVTHVDFLLIDRNAPLSVEVPVALHGSAAKVDAMKGMIDQLMYTLTVKAKPGAIPNQLDADVSHLEIGTSLKVSEVPLPEGVTTDVDPDEAVAIGSPTRSTIIMQQEAAKAAGGTAHHEGAEEEAAAAAAAE